MTDILNIPTPVLGLMVDIESLDVSARSIVTQIALYPFHLEEEELLPDSLHIFLPLQAQMDLIPTRTMSADTFVWWMGQSDDARARFERNTSDDFNELPILMRQFVSRFEKLTHMYGDYELIARGPQFDVVNIETLLRDCGLKAPWKYDKVVDLRTMCRLAGVSTKNGDVPEPHGYVPHDALWDCKYQIAQYFEAKRRLRSRG
jgi:hypothetical protein